MDLGKIGELMSLIGIVSILTMVVFVSGCTNNGLSTYSSGGVSFSYPSSWQETNPSTNSSIVALADPNSTDSNNTTTTGVEVYKIPITPNNDLKSLFNSKYESMPDFTEVDYDMFGNALNSRDYNQISNGTITVNNITAYEIIYTVNATSYENESAVSSRVYQIRDVWFEKDGNIYEIALISPADLFESQKTNFDTIINTFKVQ